MTISVEQIGLDRERIPAFLVKIENNIGVIKYSLDDSSVQNVPLSELQLAPAAYEPLQQYRCTSPENGSVHAVSDIKPVKFNNRDQVEVWLANEVTNKLNVPKTCGNQDSDQLLSNGFDVAGSLHETEKTVVNNKPGGAWWPGRILSVQNGLAHVEVAAPLNDESNCQAAAPVAAAAHVVRVGSTVPFRLSVVQMEHIRKHWPGRLVSTIAGSLHHHQAGDQPAKEVASVTLMTPGVLYRHAICIPAYLSRLAASPDTHAHLVKFCGAPCLVQCAPEPFLPSMFLRRVLTDGTGGGGEAAKPGAEGIATAPTPPSSGGDSTKSQTTTTWSSLPTQSSFSSLPVVQSVPGTLSSAGVTDPALLLEGLPGVNGPLVLLHIWSGSVEAIRRASILELAHVKLLVFRYHVLRKMSKGEPGELDLSESVENAAENGEARFLHCKPISIPVHPTNISAAVDSEAQQRAVLGVGFDQANAATPPAMMIGYSAQFRIQLRLIGLAIGHHGSTIQEARSLPGVRSVVLLQDGIIQVEAESVEACQAVQSLLDYTEAEVPVSPRLASRFIGSKGENIRKLAASAGVRRAELLGPRERQRREQAVSAYARDEAAAVGGTCKGEGDGAAEELPPPAFYLLGTRPAVAKMRLLLEFQADNWNELDELEETRRTLFSQLRQSNQRTSRVDSSSGTGISDHHRPVNGVAQSGGGFGRGRWTDAHQQQHPEHRTSQGGRFRGRGPAVNGGGGGGRMQYYQQQQPVSATATALTNSKTANDVNDNNNAAPAADATGHQQHNLPQQTATTAAGRNRGRGGPRRRLPSSASQLSHHQPAITAYQ